MASNKELKKQEKEYKKQAKEKQKAYLKQKREQEKLDKKKQKKEAKENKKLKKEERLNAKSNFLSAKSGYVYTPSYIKGNGRYASIFKIVNDYGMNHAEYEFGWFVNLIPQNTKDVTIYFFEKDKRTTDTEQRNIVSKNIENNLKIEKNTALDKDANGNDVRLKDLRIGDLRDIIIKNGQNQGIIDCDIYMMIVSKDPNKIEQEAERIQNSFTETMNGIKLISCGGEQEELFHSLFAPPKRDIYQYTWMTSDFAGNEHIVRKGLNDENGIPIGMVADNNMSGFGMMALDQSFRIGSTKERRISKINNTGDVIIASHKTSYIDAYDPDLSASSMWGQLIANDVCMHKNRVFHIVLNGFKYFGTFNEEERKFVIPPTVNEILDYYDLSGQGLNPLEMYGHVNNDPSLMKQIFNNHLDKVVQIFYLISGRDLSASVRSELRNSLEDFYIANKKWLREFDKYPSRVSAINPVSDHETFPTLGDFVSKLVVGITRSNSNTGTEAERDRLKILQNSLNSALKSNGDIFNRPTTIDQTLHQLNGREIKSMRDYKLNDNKLQFYFDLSKLKSTPNILEAQFLNIFDYVSFLAQPNDVIMVHGMDNLSVETISFLKKSIELLKDDDVRFVYMFDDVASNELELKEQDKEIQYANVFNLKGKLYHSLDESFDYTILGTMTTEEFDLYEKRLGGTRLPLIVRQHMTSSNSPDKYQIRRHSDGTSSLVFGDFYI